MAMRNHMAAAFISILCASAACSAVAQTVIDKVTVTQGTPPQCDLFPPAPSSVTNEIRIVQGAPPNIASDPFANIPGLANVSPYITLRGHTAKYTASAVFTVPKGRRYLNILWGSVDTWEGITFLRQDGSAIATVGGADLINAGIPTDNPYLTLRSPELFYSVMLWATEPGFEFSDLTFTPLAPACPT
jgi:hypothetical protein